jgi:3-dehydroquinate synthase
MQTQLAPMPRHDFQITAVFKHRIFFTRDVFAAGNPLVGDLLTEGEGLRVLILLEDSIAEAWPDLTGKIERYFADLHFRYCGVHILPGGEVVKTDDDLVQNVWQLIEDHRIDRHSYVLAIGGGAFLDATGFASATAHRGVRYLRFPTTTLSQDDSGVGVKCGINGFGKKNWIGSFYVPFAVINDYNFLHTQDEDTRRAGLIEAVKVALVMDGEFFDWMVSHADNLSKLEKEALETCVRRSALLHAQHITSGGDPFETGSSRPLDFGHWSAHKLEQMTDFSLSHAHAVAIGVALDSLYSVRVGLMEMAHAKRVIRLIQDLRLPIWHEALWERDELGRLVVLQGLEEFREHLGGRLTVLLLEHPGQGKNVHQMDTEIIERCLDDLAQMDAKSSIDLSAD